MRRVSAPSDRIAVMGAGVSALVPALLADGYRSIEAIDLSDAALDQLRHALGPDAAYVRFVRDDVRTVTFDAPIDVWHDRATFHFLTSPVDQAIYAANAATAIRPGGHLVLATFSPTGPEQCSNLDVTRWDSDDLGAHFGDRFALVDTFTRDHRTPWGASQSFTHAMLRRRN